MKEVNQKKSNLDIEILEAYPNEWYTLLDSGDGRKLEKAGPYTLIRPEAEAIWQPALGKKHWQEAHAEFVVTSEKNGGHWETYKKIPETWLVSYRGMQVRLELGNSKQIGFFPEQTVHWEWMEKRIQQSSKQLRVLNLFGYTGMASLAAAKAGAEVIHVDASKKAVQWGRENQRISNLDHATIRWLVDDVIKFVQREARRESYYDGILLDPPKFGRGPKGEVWEFYKLIPNLLQSCKSILTPEPDFVIMTAYAVKASSITLQNAMNEIMQGYKGRTSAGELTLVEKSAGRRLSTSIYVRWQGER